MNEGTVSCFHIGGERAHTDDHPAVLLPLPLASTVSAALHPGLLLKAVTEDSATVYAPLLSTDADAPCAVVDKPCDPATEQSALCLVHGTVKFRLLVTGDAKAPSQTQVAALMRNTIYPL